LNEEGVNRRSADEQPASVHQGAVYLGNGDGAVSG
jgi:hypothetical protein